MYMGMTSFTVHVPKDDDQKYIVAASIAQTAAKLFIGSTVKTEDEAIRLALKFYANVVEYLRPGDDA
jgi:hypothetical protein